MKMETEQMMELLLAKMDTSTKTLQKQMMANRTADREFLKLMIVSLKNTQEKIGGAIHSMRSELNVTFQHRIEKVMRRVNLETQSLQKAC
jgi:hypothetical protein